MVKTKYKEIENMEEDVIYIRTLSEDETDDGKGMVEFIGKAKNGKKFGTGTDKVIKGIEPKLVSTNEVRDYFILAVSNSLNREYGIESKEGVIDYPIKYI